jgi:hypothetical protein
MINLNRPRREKMAKKNDTPDTSSSVFDEIQQQLDHALAKKKEDLERELEERIRKEKEEMQRRMEELERELNEEKGTLVDFQTLLAEFESNKTKLKKQIKDHIDKAINFQTEIETMTGQTLEELRKVSELNQKLEELQQETEAKVSTLKKTLEEKFGIVAEMPEREEYDETEIDLDHELAKLRKIKELLNSNGPVVEVLQEMEPQETMEEQEVEKPAEESVDQLEGEPLPEEEKREEEEPFPAEEPEKEPEEIEEPVSEETAEPVQEGDEASFQTAFDKLEEFRKGSTNENDAEVSYFENNDQIVLDGEYIVSSLNNCFEEAKKLYIRLSQTESPKDQFFIKQEIIKQQEALRKVMLRSIRMCEKDNCSLPEYTSEILNLDVLKSALEKVSMQNWSNQDDFASFDSFAKGLKDSFYTRITPPAAYLKSIMKELNIS